MSAVAQMILGTKTPAVIVPTLLVARNPNPLIDYSPNAYTVTTVGSVTTGSDGPFTGSGYISTGSAAGNLSCAVNSVAYPTTTTTPFTIEAWVYVTSSNGCYIVSSQFNTSAVKYMLMLGSDPDVADSRYPIFGFYPSWQFLKSTTQVALNTWTHVAAVFTGSTCKIFQNGILTDTGGPSTWTVAGSTSAPVYVGARWDTFTSPSKMSGSLSNVRIVMGQAVYSSNFTPPSYLLPA